MANLPFKDRFSNNTPTLFIPKIWSGILKFYDEVDFVEHENPFLSYYIYHINAGKKSELVKSLFPPYQDIRNFIPKVTTIREDKNDFWKPQRLIHMQVFNRSKNMFRFMPILRVKSIQKIEILSSRQLILVDGKGLALPEMKKLMNNDGFDNATQFWGWFSKDFKGKIIHWTDLKYGI